MRWTSCHQCVARDGRPRGGWPTWGPRSSVPAWSPGPFRQHGPQKRGYDAVLEYCGRGDVVRLYGHRPVDRHRSKHGGGLNLSGTVTAIGSTTVTIKTGTGTTVYTVDANSDIDKNGEASLSSLRRGDAMTFDRSSATTIAKLHAGDETLNRPNAAAGSPTSG